MTFGLPGYVSSIIALIDMFIEFLFIDMIFKNWLNRF